MHSGFRTQLTLVAKQEAIFKTSPSSSRCILSKLASHKPISMQSLLRTSTYVNQLVLLSLCGAVCTLQLNSVLLHDLLENLGLIFFDMSSFLFVFSPSLSQIQLIGLLLLRESLRTKQRRGLVAGKGAITTEKG